MRHFIALFVVLLSMVIQPMPHFHACDEATHDMPHQQRGHVHLCFLWESHAEAPEESTSSEHAPNEHSHDHDVIYVADHSATLSSDKSDIGPPTSIVIHNAAPILLEHLAKGLQARSIDLIKVPGSVSGVPHYLQGGTFLG